MMDNLAVNYALFLASIIVCAFSVAFILSNAWCNKILDVTSIKAACVMVLSLLLAMMLYGKIRAY